MSKHEAKTVLENTSTMGGGSTNPDDAYNASVRGAEVFDADEQVAAFDTDAAIEAMRNGGYKSDGSYPPVVKPEAGSALFDLEARILAAQAAPSATTGKRRVTMYIDADEYKALAKLAKFVGLDVPELAANITNAAVIKGLSLLPQAPLPSDKTG